MDLQAIIHTGANLLHYIKSQLFPISIHFHVPSPHLFNNHGTPGLLSCSSNLFWNLRTVGTVSHCERAPHRPRGRTSDSKRDSGGGASGTCEGKAHALHCSCHFVVCPPRHQTHQNTMRIDSLAICLFAIPSIQKLSGWVRWGGLLVVCTQQIRSCLQANLWHLLFNISDDCVRPTSDELAKQSHRRGPSESPTIQPA